MVCSSSYGEMKLETLARHFPPLNIHLNYRYTRLDWSALHTPPLYLVRSSTWSERSFLSADASALAPAAPRRWFPVKRSRRTPDAGGGAPRTTPSSPSPPSPFSRPAFAGASRSALVLLTAEPGEESLSASFAAPAFAAAALLRSAEEMYLAAGQGKREWSKAQRSCYLLIIVQHSPADLLH